MSVKWLILEGRLTCRLYICFANQRELTRTTWSISGQSGVAFSQSTNRNENIYLPKHHIVLGASHHLIVCLASVPYCNHASGGGKDLGLVVIHLFIQLECSRYMSAENNSGKHEKRWDFCNPTSFFIPTPWREVFSNTVIEYYGFQVSLAMLTINNSCLWVTHINTRYLDIFW